MIGNALTTQERAILDIEKQWWKYTAVKEKVARETLGLSATRYYLKLNKLLDNPAASAAEPMLVNRLRAKRDGGA